MTIVQEIISTEPMHPRVFKTPFTAKKQFRLLAEENGLEVPEDIDGNLGLSTDGYEVHIWFNVSMEDK